MISAKRDQPDIDAEQRSSVGVDDSDQVQFAHPEAPGCTDRRVEGVDPGNLATQRAIGRVPGAGRHDEERGSGSVRLGGAGGPAAESARQALRDSPHGAVTANRDQKVGGTGSGSVRGGLDRLVGGGRPQHLHEAQCTTAARLDFSRDPARATPGSGVDDHQRTLGRFQTGHQAFICTGSVRSTSLYQLRPIGRG